MRARLLAFFTLFSLAAYPQDAEPSGAKQPEVQGEASANADPMEEFLSLRGKHVRQNLPPEDLFRLANLYLIHSIYPKSAELYAELIQYLETTPAGLSEEQRLLYLMRSHYNRGLALFTLGLYESSKANFERAYYYNAENIEALRMLGSIGFAQKNKEAAEDNWSAYLAAAPEGPIKDSVQKALDLLRSPDFSFEAPDPKTGNPPPDASWPFRSYESIPYPDALYEKKRLI